LYDSTYCSRVGIRIKWIPIIWTFVIPITIFQTHSS
jgi:hypothetical protein